MPMNKIAIKIENLSKSYSLTHNQTRSEKYLAFRDVLADKAARIIGGAFGNSVLKKNDSSKEEFWALKNITLDINEGERVGVIGRNGAGKSTLLKILSRITEPTSGRVTLHGKVSSLLEVGTGFHPELSGRENIFLNGSILGMSRKEIQRKFDEIVDFAEVEKFLDTPVKRYSSGMYVRLAFAVAAHLEPEILIVDEVLAVGDAQFQKKCLGKMDQVANQGRTVIFVSHNMAAISALCSRSVLISSGQLAYSGKTEDVINYYVQNKNELNGEMQPLESRYDREGDGSFKFINIELLDANYKKISYAKTGDDIIFALDFIQIKDRYSEQINFEIGIYNNYDQLVTLCGSEFGDSQILKVGRDGTIYCRVNNLSLMPGSYKINIFAGISGASFDWVKNAYELMVEDGGYYASGRMPPNNAGIILTDHSWATN